jgi:hypothetical protein
MKRLQAQSSLLPNQPLTSRRRKPARAVARPEPAEHGYKDKHHHLKLPELLATFGVLPWALLHLLC